MVRTTARALTLRALLAACAACAAASAAADASVAPGLVQASLEQSGRAAATDAPLLTLSFDLDALAKRAAASDAAPIRSGGFLIEDDDWKRAWPLAANLGAVAWVAADGSAAAATLSEDVTLPEARLAPRDAMTQSSR
jgi:hypothetical protein